jgi:hypothetical protein
VKQNRWAGKTGGSVFYAEPPVHVVNKDKDNGLSALNHTVLSLNANFPKNCEWKD